MCVLMHAVFVCVFTLYVRVCVSACICVYVYVCVCMSPRHMYVYTLQDLLIEALKYHLISPNERQELARSLPDNWRIRDRHRGSLPHILMVIGGQAPKVLHYGVCTRCSMASQSSGEGSDRADGSAPPPPPPPREEIGFFAPNMARVSALLLLFWMNWVNHPGQKVV